VVFFACDEGDPIFMCILVVLVKIDEIAVKWVRLEAELLLLYNGIKHWELNQRELWLLHYCKFK